MPATAGDLALLGLDEFPDASISIFDRDLRYLVVRGAAVRDAGLDPATIEGRLVRDALSPQRWAVYRGPYEAALHGERTTLQMPSPEGPAAT